MKNRDSITYRLRRKIQIAALKLTSREFMSKRYFKMQLKYPLNLKEPKTLNEKLQWLKLRYWENNAKAVQCADKYAVRKYIEEIGEGELLNELLFVWDSVDEIDWDALPDKFAIKCNHGCAYNIICSDKSKLDKKATEKKLRRWMKEDFSLFNAEPHYSKIPRKIICEKFLEGEVINYNIYCFNGVPTFISVAGGLADGVGEHLTYYNADGTVAEFKNRNYPTHENKLSEKLPEMIETAKRLSRDFPMVRVDLFDIGGKIILSEMTFTPGAAIIPIEPVEWDRKLGDKLDISAEISQFQKK